MLLMQLCIRMQHHATLKCLPVHHGHGHHTHKVQFARFMSINFIIALEMYLGAYAWGFAVGGGTMAMLRQICATAFLVLGVLRTVCAVLLQKKHHHYHQHAKEKKAGLKEDKLPLLPEKQQDAAYNC